MTGGWHPFRALRRALPRRLFGRSLIIIVAPMVLLQGMVTYAFFVRNYSVMTRHLSAGVAASVAYLVDLTETHPDSRERKALLEADTSGVEPPAVLRENHCGELARGRDQTTPALLVHVAQN